MIISVVHHAGGVGKTTTTLNLGYALAEKGMAVLLVDLDPQADLSERLRLTPHPDLPNLANVLGTGRGEVEPLRCEWGGVQVDVIPSTLDMAILVDVYHEFDFPFEMISKIVNALKPSGRLMFVEFRAEDPNVPIKTVHKMTEAQVKLEMTDHPLKWVETKEVLPWQHLIVFRKG